MCILPPQSRKLLPIQYSKFMNGNQLILNNFGHEDISHISDKFMQKLLSIPYVGVQKLIEKVHFSKKKPENKNIKLISC
mgnify:CR=1 FL=1